MTAQEYLDQRLFPLSSQPGLSLDDQMELDSINFDEYSKARKRHESLSDHERAIGRELEAKNAARGSVLRQVQGDFDSSGGFPQGPDGNPFLPR